VYLSREDACIVLEVIDDGCGFDVTTAQAAGGLGLNNLYERTRRIGGVLKILSMPGTGTRVRVVVPEVTL